MMIGQSQLMKVMESFRLSRDFSHKLGDDRYESLRMERQKLVNLLVILKQEPTIIIDCGEVAFDYPEQSEQEKTIHQFIAHINSMLPELQKRVTEDRGAL